jgi:SAM-dependent methyltransferase
MLNLNRYLAAIQGLNITYVQGDVEHLPFPTAHFDTVVSITVVRHFPQYQNILREYVRVLKPGGKLIFEMCSGDHISRANRIMPRFGVRYAQNDFRNYEVETPFAGLQFWLDSIGVDVVQRLTYDFLNSNCFLKIFTWNDLGYKIVRKQIELVLRLSPVQKLAAWMETTVLCNLPTVLSYNYMIIGRKR